MFHKADETGYHQAAPGVKLKTLAHGRQTLISEFRMSAGSVLPCHSHPHEQTGYLVSGHLKLTIGQHTHDVGPGDGWCIPGDTEHSALVLAESVAVEVFSPVREDYLAYER